MKGDAGLPRPGAAHPGRRRFLGDTAKAILMLALSGRTLLRADAPGRLDPADPSAKAIGYIEDAAKIDPKKEPLFKPASRCRNCNFYQAVDAKADSAPCTIFANQRVAGPGWCRAWAQKT